MEDEFERELEDEEKRVSDALDYDDLLHRFAQNGMYGSYLVGQAEYISHYLGYRSPENRIAGLMAHQSAILAGINRILSRILARILVVMAVNTALVGYIVYRLI